MSGITEPYVKSDWTVESAIVDLHVRSVVRILIRPLVLEKIMRWSVECVCVESEMNAECVCVERERKVVCVCGEKERWRGGVCMCSERDEGEVCMCSERESERKVECVFVVRDIECEVKVDRKNVEWGRRVEKRGPGKI